MRLTDENVRELNTELVVLDKQFRRLIQLDDVKNKIDNGLLTVDCTANELASKSKYIEISTNIEFKESGLIDRGNFGGLYVNRIAIDQIKNLTRK